MSILPLTAALKLTGVTGISLIGRERVFGASAGAFGASTGFGGAAGAAAAGFGAAGFGAAGAGAAAPAAPARNVNSLVKGPIVELFSTSTDSITPALGLFTSRVVLSVST